MKLTDNQQQAIDIRDANVLVSAAAGSGKTSVLVKRVVERLISEKDPVDVDRLLIMTFTNAAAEEMRSRIRDAIDARLNELAKSPAEDDGLRLRLEKQSLLVHNAMITTIHGFCKSVITDHFEEVSIDPDFRVADENECKLLRQDALDECLEAAYEKADPAFLAAVECFSATRNAKNDSGLALLVIPIYEYIMADPDPEGFARKCASHYEYASFDDFVTSPIMECMNRMITRQLQGIKKLIDLADTLIEGHEELIPYKDCITAFKDALTTIKERQNEGEDHLYDITREVLGSLAVPAFGRVIEKGLDDDTIAAKNRVKKIRDDAKAMISKILSMMPFDLQGSFENVIAAAPAINALIDIVLDFARVYEAKKRDKNVIDFNDMEHMALSVLKNPQIADIYRQKYEEIYVDEYQDTNMTQEMIVSLICRKEPGNVFQVGDVKQSIYRFRQARPDIFIGKYDTYKDDDGQDRRILLNENFRSRREVIDAVNEVFEAIMKRDLGGIEYDDNAKLKFAAEYYPKCTDENDTYKAELVFGVRQDLSSPEFAANYVAGRINEMISEGFMVYDTKAEAMRPISYGDFTILVRSIRSCESRFREVFAACEIPFGVEGREGYFSTIEVRTALAFLEAVDNPNNDIPITTLMRSPIGSFTDTELATITAATSSTVFVHDRIRAITENDDIKGVSDELKGKCRAFLDMLKRFREMSLYSPVHKILEDFIDKQYKDHVLCMSRGGQRMANLQMLLSKAEDYGRTSFKGLYQFVRYMDQIRKYEIDNGEAGTVSEHGDAVTLMTMHGSKGLEFPVCFLVGMENRRNSSDENATVIRSVKYGFGIHYRDLVRRTVATTIPYNVVSADNMYESIAEEMRILYVAMTRAREKLIMVATGKKDTLDEPAKSIDRAASYLDMIKAAMPDGGFSHIKCSSVTEQDLVASRMDSRIRTDALKDELNELIKRTPEKNGDISEGKTDTPSCLIHVGFKYPYPINPKLKAKLSVSELKHRIIEERIANGEDIVSEGEQLFKDTEPDHYIPKFMREEGQTVTGGTFYGSAFHRILELWDYPTGTVVTNNNICDVTPDMITEFAQKMHKTHHMDADQVAAIRPDDVALFLNSPLGRRMRDAKTAGTLFREQPFVIGVPEDGEIVLVQGIIDAYFTEDDGITIVDYKTDRVDSEDQLINRYRAQLEYYGMALSQITKRPIKALAIWSTRLRKEIIIA